MGPDISYQVSAWKIYKVRRQWEAGTKSSYLYQHCGPAPRSTLLSAATEKMISPLSFPSHASQIRCSHAAESYRRRYLAAQEELWKSPPLEREVWGQVEQSGMEEAVVHVILFRNQQLANSLGLKILTSFLH